MFAGSFLNISSTSGITTAVGTAKLSSISDGRDAGDETGANRITSHSYTFEGCGEIRTFSKTSSNTRTLASNFIVSLYHHSFSSLLSASISTSCQTIRTTPSYPWALIAGSSSSRMQRPSQEDSEIFISLPRHIHLLPLPKTTNAIAMDVEYRSESSRQLQSASNFFDHPIPTLISGSPPTHPRGFHAASALPADVLQRSSEAHSSSSASVWTSASCQ